MLMSTEILYNKADINKIGIVETDRSRFAIVSEWSRDAIDIFDTFSEAKDFLIGFHNNTGLSYAAHRGIIMRSCINFDINMSEEEYIKLTDIDKKYGNRLYLLT